MKNIEEKRTATRITVRFSEDELRKVEEIAHFSGGNISEALRKIVRLTRLEPATITMPHDNHPQEALAL